MYAINGRKKSVMYSDRTCGENVRFLYVSWTVGNKCRQQLEERKAECKVLMVSSRPISEMQEGNIAIDLAESRV